jgi:endonuclease/exonuclease/phosphatase family metal-dependent hydrolase
MKRPSRRVVFRVFAAISVLGLAFVLLFVLNGLLLADRTTPRVRQVPVAATTTTAAPGEVTILTWNIAKCFVHRGGTRFESPGNVKATLRLMSRVILRENPDFVFLSEAITECGPCDVNQVETLAQDSGLPYAVSGENYNVGLPFYRIVGGNAVLSRTPLTPVKNIDLAGRKSFWVTSNNRRALVVSAEIAGRDVLLAALHNDSFDMRNNETQARQILDFLGDRPAVVAGDFNNRPEERSMKLFQNSGRFSGAFDGPPTFFEGGRKERLDYILAPAGWELLDHRVIEDDTSDHRPLVCRFRVK